MLPPETAQCLVTARAAINAARPDGTTALMRAAQEGHVETAQYLVYSGKPWSSSILLLPNYDAAIAELEQCSRRARSAKTGEILTGIRDNIASLKAMLRSGGGAEPVLAAVKYPASIKLLKARICGVVFPEDFTQKLSGIPLAKFNHIVPLIRAAKIAKIAHGVNSYFFTRIFMLKSSVSSILTTTSFTLQAKTHLLSFILGKAEARTLMLELQAISASAIAPAVGAAALKGASEPEPSAAAHPCKKSL